MTLRGGGLVVMALVLAGCGSPDSGAPGDDQLPPDSTVANRPAEPASLADVAPGDTAGVLALIRGWIRTGDELAATLVPRDTLLNAGEGLEPRRLRLWLQDGRPVKLHATEPNATDRVAGETIVWFRLGEIAVAQRSPGTFLFAADGLIFTADESLVPVALDPELESSIEREVIDSVKARLAVFGVGYP